MFGALHYFPQVIAGTTLLGILMALLYERSGSLWVPVVLHVTYNSASLIMLYAFLYMGIDFGPGIEAQILAVLDITRQQLAGALAAGTITATVGQADAFPQGSFQYSFVGFAAETVARGRYADYKTHV